MAKSAPKPTKRRTVKRRVQPDSAKAPTKAAPVEESDSPKVDAAEKSSAEAFIESVKDSLEYELANKQVHVTIKGKRLTFTSWGLVKEMQYGGRVLALAQRLSSVVDVDQLSSGNMDLSILSQLFSLVAADALDILAGSISDPFKAHGDAYEWIDTECDFADLLNMAVIVYDQNFRGDSKSLGKRMESLKGAITGITSLMMPKA